MLGFIKKYLNLVLTGSVSVVFAACYGPPMELENPKQVNAKDNNDNAIPGLKVTLYENRMQIDEQFTDENGSVVFHFPQNEKYLYKAKVEDVDGTDNLGDFQTKEVDLTSDSYIDLKLDKKQ